MVGFEYLLHWLLRFICTKEDCTRVLAASLRFKVTTQAAYRFSHVYIAANLNYPKLNSTQARNKAT